MSTLLPVIEIEDFIDLNRNYTTGFYIDKVGVLASYKPYRGYLIENNSDGVYIATVGLYDGTEVDASSKMIEKSAILAVMQYFDNLEVNEAWLRGDITYKQLKTWYDIKILIKGYTDEK